jgi:hypothetical protein
MPRPDRVELAGTKKMRSLVLICALALSATAQPPNLRLPDESTGIDGIARTLISVFDQADIIALGA